jgi:hypothetical protein
MNEVILFRVTIEPLSFSICLSMPFFFLSLSYFVSNARYDFVGMKNEQTPKILIGNKKKCAVITLLPYSFTVSIP